jgi:hypothetical protein
MLLCVVTAVLLGAWPVAGAGMDDQPLLPLTFSEEVTPGATSAKICFKLPATHTGVVGATVAIVDKDDAVWIITHASYATPFNVSKGKEQQGCIVWNGLDENFWPIPPGTYGVKGIFTNVSLWEVDGKYHALVPEVTGSVGPIPIDLAASPSNQTFFVTGDACGTSFSSIGLSANFADRPDHSNLYHTYLENSYNNYLLNMSKPHGYGQAQWRWHDAGLQGGAHTATNGRSVWSVSTITGPKLYRADVGNENVAAWGLCNFSFFYTFPGVLCLPEGATAGGGGMFPAVPAKGAWKTEVLGLEVVPARCAFFVLDLHSRMPLAGVHFLTG